jgi:DNA-directed RNA polymerase beta' subunit/DNA-directed RNA polymerase subunit K/omega
MLPLTTAAGTFGLPGQLPMTALPNQIPILAPAENTTVVTKGERDEILAATARKEAELPLLTIVRSAISLYSYEEMLMIAPVAVTSLNLQGSNSVNDNRMGVVSLNQACHYCSQIDCPGHYGRIDFRVPIYNPAFIREVVSVLTCVCNDCGGLLITEDVMRQQGFMRLSYDKRLAALEAHCKDIGCLRSFSKDIIPCTKNPVFITTDIREKGEIIYKLPQDGGRKVTAEDAPHLMPIETVISILERISEEDARLLGFPKGSHPRNMIMRAILVPPVIARPPIYESGSIFHDQLTHTYINIMRKVTDIHHGKAGAIGELYKAVKHLIFKSDAKKTGGREFLSIVERIQGKSALLRGLLMGKRVNDCGRTVAGPDPSLKYGQIRLPEMWAPVLTKKVTVTRFNIRHLTNLLEQGRIVHVTFKDTGLRKFYDRNRFKYQLRIGDQVERWLENGDRVIVNRQPTLHRQSMMGYEVVLGPQLTIGLHLSYTTPMNCDFDGDENNAWNPQDFEVEAEVEILMNVKENIMSAEQNKPIMGLVMNSVTGAFLMSMPTTRLDDDLFAELLGMVTDPTPIRTLYARLMKYGVHPRSGQAIFSAMLPEDFTYNQKGVKILEGVLVEGVLKKSHVGTSDRSIIQELYKKYGSAVTSNFFTDAPWIINKWIIERGFSVGMLDCINLAIDDEGKEYDKNTRILEEELAKIYVQLEALGGKLDDPIEETYRQRQINNLVNIAQGIGLRLAKDVLSRDNSIGVMTDQGAGTKGGIANVGQMFGAVGQQFYRGERLRPTMTGGRRILPTYDVDDNNPEANAFLPVSFYTGLSPEGLFFLQAGGREGILDTALKTADTGAMQHRMIKAFENVIIGNDGSIRNTIGTMFAPMYNNGYDIAEMMVVDHASKPRLTSFIDIKSLVSELNVKRGWVTASDNADIIRRRASLQNVEFETTATPEPIEKVLPLPPADYVRGPSFFSMPAAYDVTQPVPRQPSLRKISKFEKSRIIGTRSVQLSNNAPPLVDIGDEIDPIKIAMMEYNAGILRLYVVRRYANGEIERIYPTLDNI